jgi:hypothetical protein
MQISQEVNRCACRRRASAADCLSFLRHQQELVRSSSYIARSVPIMRFNSYYVAAREHSRWWWRATNSTVSVGGCTPAGRATYYSSGVLHAGRAPLLRRGRHLCRDSSSVEILLLRLILISGPFVWQVADGWCWFFLREKYCWLVSGGLFVLREKYYWLVADKANEQGVCRQQTAWLLVQGLGINFTDERRNERCRADRASSQPPRVQDRGET